MVERSPVKRMVVGSNPTAGASDRKTTHFFFRELLFKSSRSHLLPISSTHSIVFMGADSIETL